LMGQSYDALRKAKITTKAVPQTAYQRLKKDFRDDPAEAIGGRVEEFATKPFVDPVGAAESVAGDSFSRFCLFRSAQG